MLWYYSELLDQPFSKENVLFEDILATVLWII